MKQQFYLLAISAILCSCGSPATTSDTATATSDSFDVSKVRQSIEAVNKKFTDASLKGDSAGIVALYHTDAKIFPPNMHEDDRNMAGSMMTSIPKMGIKSFTLSTTDVTGDANQVVEIGTYEMGNGSKTVDKGKYIVVWKPENGDWKLWRDIWNSDNPPAAPQKK